MKTTRQSRLIRTALVASLLLVLGSALMALPASADVVHLRTGEAVKGRPSPSESDDHLLAIEDYLSGAMRRFRWEVVDDADEARLKRLWGWTNEAQGTVEGDVLIQRLDGGGREELNGVVEKEDDTYVWIRQNGQLLKVPTAQVVERRKEDMDPRDIWNADQLWERYLDEQKGKGVDVDAMDAREHFLAGQHAEWIDALERAREHFGAAADDEGYLQSGLARTRLERVEALIRDSEARAFLKQMRMWLGHKSFRRVKAAIAEFADKHPDVSDTTSTVLERFKAKYERTRNEYMQNMARNQFPKIAEKLIEKKVKEDDVTLTDVTAWTRRELPEEAFKALAAAMQRRDDITPEEAQSFWEQRKKKKWLVRSYGSGTFIVKPAQVKPPKRKSRSGGGGRGGGNKAGPRLPTPKPPTRDQWWARSKARARTSWAMAYFAERSGLFDVNAEPKLSSCRVCNGEGLESSVSQTGAISAYLCTRCAGTRNDWGVRFR